VAVMDGGRAARPTMEDVARLTGVSHQTVSRVLNDHPNVRAPTRANVLAAIRALGYRPNAAVRSLVTKRTGYRSVEVD
jgi:DNA-binding LacI/PurR family transcriptional regulator